MQDSNQRLRTAEEERGDPPGARLKPLVQALNRHDLAALEDCFAPALVSETPAHPDRSFRGREQMRKNWTQIFAAVPDIRAVLVDSAIEGGRVWAEWDWTGTRADGAPFAMRGVTILGIREGQVASVRFYMEPVELGGPDPDAAVRRAVATPSSTA